MRTLGIETSSDGLFPWDCRRRPAGRVAGKKDREF